MHRCFQLALLGADKVAPNHMVGAVLVNDNRIIGEGFHEIYGGPHAEVNCINKVDKADKHLINKSRLYVSLEPCTHFGKTPPCTDLIIKNKIAEVVVGCRDSFEKVNGSGIQKLQLAGIKVITGVLEKEALELNVRFFTFQKKQRPYIILKWAQSNNLKIANADHSRVRISNEVTNRLVHKWRSEEAAIMVGTQTALNDNPSLTTRLWEGNNPVRVVIDKNLTLPTGLNLFDNSVPTIILNTIKQEENGNNSYYKTGPSEDMMAVTLNVLRQRNLISVIIEGGAALIQSFIDAEMWDEARVITNKSMVIKNGINAPSLNCIEFRKEQIGTDEILYYRNSE